MFDNLFAIAGKTGTASILFALLLTILTAVAIGMCARERDRMRGHVHRVSRGARRRAHVL